MNFRQANHHCRILCRNYQIRKPPRVVGLKETRRGDCVVLGHYTRLHNEIEINLFTMDYWKDHEIIETLQHELAHRKCYEKYSRYDGEHDDRFFSVCKELGLSDFVAKAIKD